MKCRVCGAESGNYPLCRSCNQKKEQGLIIKCSQCGQWHYANAPCPQNTKSEYLYELRKTLITANEQQYFTALRELVPEGYCVFPQINLATFLEKTDDSSFHNELFRNVDFLVTDAAFAPRIVIEINDPSHREYNRRKRDIKVLEICEEAGIPLITLWTNYGVNRDYIKGRIQKALESPPQRVAHSAKRKVEQGAAASEGAPAYAQHQQAGDWDVQAEQHNAQRKKKQGCYVATCVYGSYDCPQVWILRRYRDSVLKKTLPGRCFVAVYYAVSPWMVQTLGSCKAIRNIWRRLLDPVVQKLREKGFSDTPYCDL